MRWVSGPWRSLWAGPRGPCCTAFTCCPPPCLSPCCMERGPGWTAPLGTKWSISGTTLTPKCWWVTRETLYPISGLHNCFQLLLSVNQFIVVDCAVGNELLTDFSFFFFCVLVQLVNDASHHVYADQPEQFNRVVENICNSVNWPPASFQVCVQKRTESSQSVNSGAGTEVPACQAWRMVFYHGHRLVAQSKCECILSLLVLL